MLFNVAPLQVSRTVFIPFIFFFWALSTICPGAGVGVTVAVAFGMGVTVAVAVAVAVGVGVKVAVGVGLDVGVGLAFGLVITPLIGGQDLQLVASKRVKTLAEARRIERTLKGKKIRSNLSPAIVEQPERFRGWSGVRLCPWQSLEFSIADCQFHCVFDVRDLLSGG